MLYLLLFSLLWLSLSHQASGAVKELGGRVSWRAIAPANPCPMRRGGSLALPMRLGGSLAFPMRLGGSLAVPMRRGGSLALPMRLGRSLALPMPLGRSLALPMRLGGSLALPMRRGGSLALPISLDFSAYRESADFRVTRERDVLIINWYGENGISLRLSLNLVDPEKLIAELSHAASSA